MRGIKRLSEAARLLWPGALAAWVVLAILQVALAPWPGALPVVFAAGADAMWLWLSLAVGALLLAILPRRASAWAAGERRQGAEPRPPRFGRWQPAVAALATALVSLLAWLATRPLAGALLPGAIDLRSYFVDGAGWGLACALGALAGLLSGGGRGVAALALALWRLLARDALPVVFLERELLLELGSLWLLLVALTPLARRALPRPVSIGGFVATVLAAALLLGSFDASARAAAAFSSRLRGPSALLIRARALLDFDADGFSGMLGGGDCDDADGDVYPGAPELVGNGEDDNCLGGDLAEVPPEAEAAASAAATPKSVILVTIDALRADMVAPGQTDALLRHAARGARFTRAYAAAPFTDYSLRSLMTGRLPMNLSDHRWFLGQDPSLAERLGALGYATLAIHSIYQANFLFVLGFGEVDDELAPLNEGFHARTAAALSDRALAAFARLSASGRPFFLWVHYFDPHSDYVGVPEAPRFEPGGRGRYRQEVWATDREVGRLLDAVAASGFLERGVVAVLADHGELLGENGRIGHAFWVDEPVLRVPLVLLGAGVPAGVFDTRVRSLDLYPTLAELAAGLLPPSDGASLLPVIRGEDRADRDVFALGQYEDSNLRVAISGPWKLTQDVRTGTEVLIRLDEDPDGRDNRIDRAPEDAARMRRLLGQRWDLSYNDVVLLRKFDRLGSFPGRAAYDDFFTRSMLRQCERGRLLACRGLERLARRRGAPP